MTRLCFTPIIWYKAKLLNKLPNDTPKKSNPLRVPISYGILCGRRMKYLAIVGKTPPIRMLGKVSKTKIKITLKYEIWLPSMEKTDFGISEIKGKIRRRTREQTPINKSQFISKRILAFFISAFSPRKTAASCNCQNHQLQQPALKAHARDYQQQ